MKTLSPETKEKIASLRMQVKALNIEVNNLWSNMHRSDDAGLINNVDNCIDVWNAVINRAPQTLKAAKLELL